MYLDITLHVWKGFSTPHPFRYELSPTDIGHVHSGGDIGQPACKWCDFGCGSSQDHRTEMWDGPASEGVPLQVRPHCSTKYNCISQRFM